jgi:3-oxoacyl-[acyl-carrier-protein] synthase II
MAKKRIVVTGMGIASCLGNDPDTFYQRLLQGESGISTITTFPCDELPSRIGGVVHDFDPGDLIEKKQARRIDRFIAFALWAGKKALLSSGLSLTAEGIDRTRAGVIIGSGVGGMSTFFDNAKICVEKGPRRVTPFLIPFILTNMGSALLAEDLGFMGPNYSLSTACATSNYAIIAAAQHIARGEADLMICGGTEAPVAPIGLAGFCAMRALSGRNDAPQKASRPFDKGRDGFVIAEGCGVLVLESLESAQRRGAPILAEYLGGGLSCDAYHMTEPRADGLGVALCIERALNDAGVKPEQVTYINAHATSTMVGDMTEIRALERIFVHPESVVLSATKSMVGHSLGAAGGIEAIATIQAIRTGFIHPTINLDDPEDLPFELPREKKKVDIECAISNSFGFGGHNATVVFAPFCQSRE